MSLIDDLTWCDRHDVEGSLCYERGYPLEQCVKGTRLVLDPRVLADGPVILLPDEGEGVRVVKLVDWLEQFVGDGSTEIDRLTEAIADGLTDLAAIIDRIDGVTS